MIILIAKCKTIFIVGTTRMMILFKVTKPCRTRVIWHCHNPFSQRQLSKKAALPFAKFLWQCHVTIVRQGPGVIVCLILEDEWRIIYHCFLWLQCHIHTLNPVLIGLFSVNLPINYNLIYHYSRHWELCLSKLLTYFLQIFHHIVARKLYSHMHRCLSGNIHWILWVLCQNCSSWGLLLYQLWQTSCRHIITVRSHGHHGLSDHPMTRDSSHKGSVMSEL